MLLNPKIDSPCSSLINGMRPPNQFHSTFTFEIDLQYPRVYPNEPALINVEIKLQSVCRTNFFSFTLYEYRCRSKDQVTLKGRDGLYNQQNVASTIAEDISWNLWSRGDLGNGLLFPALANNQNIHKIIFLIAPRLQEQERISKRGIRVYVWKKLIKYQIDIIRLKQFVRMLAYDCAMQSIMPSIIWEHILNQSNSAEIIRLAITLSKKQVKINKCGWFAKDSKEHQEQILHAISYASDDTFITELYMKEFEQVMFGVGTFGDGDLRGCSCKNKDSQ